MKRKPSGHPRLRSPTLFYFIYLLIYIYIYIYIYYWRKLFNFFYYWFYEQIKKGRELWSLVIRTLDNFRFDHIALMGNNKFHFFYIYLFRGKFLLNLVGLFYHIICIVRFHIIYDRFYTQVTSCLREKG